MKRYIIALLLCFLFCTLSGCTMESRMARAEFIGELDDLITELEHKNAVIEELEEVIEEYERELEISWEEYASLEEQLDEMKYELWLYSMRTCIVPSGDYRYHTYECLSDTISVASDFQIYNISTARNYGYEPHACIG